MKKFYALIIGIALFATVAAPLVSGVPVHAAAQSQALCEGSGGQWTVDKNDATKGVCSTPGSNRTVLGTIQQITDILIFIVGAISVLMIIIGGLRYATSGGDQNGLTSAKNTILYAVIGIIVAFMAYAIVHFVLGALGIK